MMWSDVLLIETQRKKRKHESMRCVVKDKQTGRFLGRSGEWTEHLNEAHQFPNRLSISLHLEDRAESAPPALEVVHLPIG